MIKFWNTTISVPESLKKILTIRLWDLTARYIDIELVITLIIFLVYFIHPYDPSTSSPIPFLLLLLLIPLIDSGICRIFGNSLGKALLGIKLVKNDSSPNFSTLLMRNYCLYIFILSIIPMRYCSLRIGRGQNTPYDEALGISVVRSKKRGVAMTALSIFIYILIILIHRSFYVLPFHKVNYGQIMRAENKCSEEVVFTLLYRDLEGGDLVRFYHLSPNSFLNLEDPYFGKLYEKYGDYYYSGSSVSGKYVFEGNDNMLLNGGINWKPVKVQGNLIQFTCE